MPRYSSAVAAGAEVGHGSGVRSESPPSPASLPQPEGRAFVAASAGSLEETQELMAAETEAQSLEHWQLSVRNVFSALSAACRRWVVRAVLAAWGSEVRRVRALCRPAEEAAATEQRLLAAFALWSRETMAAKLQKAGRSQRSSSPASKSRAAPSEEQQLQQQQAKFHDACSSRNGSCKPCSASVVQVRGRLVAKLVATQHRWLIAVWRMAADSEIDARRQATEARSALEAAERSVASACEAVEVETWDRAVARIAKAELTCSSGLASHTSSPPSISATQQLTHPPSPSCTSGAGASNAWCFSEGGSGVGGGMDRQQSTDLLGIIAEFERRAKIAQSELHERAVACVELRDALEESEASATSARQAQACAARAAARDAELRQAAQLEERAAQCKLARHGAEQVEMEQQLRLALCEVRQLKERSASALEALEEANASTSCSADARQQLPAAGPNLLPQQVARLQEEVELLRAMRHRWISRTAGKLASSAEAEELRNLLQRWSRYANQLRWRRSVSSLETELLDASRAEQRFCNAAHLETQECEEARTMLAAEEKEARLLAERQQLQPVRYLRTAVGSPSSPRAGACGGLGAVNSSISGEGGEERSALDLRAQLRSAEYWEKEAQEGWAALRRHRFHLSSFAARCTLAELRVFFMAWQVATSVAATANFQAEELQRSRLAEELLHERYEAMAQRLVAQEVLSNGLREAAQDAERRLLEAQEQLLLRSGGGRSEAPSSHGKAAGRCQTAAEERWDMHEHEEERGVAMIAALLDKRAAQARERPRHLAPPRPNVRAATGGEEGDDDLSSSTDVAHKRSQDAAQHRAAQLLKSRIGLLRRINGQ